MNKVLESGVELILFRVETTFILLKKKSFILYSIAKQKKIRLARLIFPKSFCS